MPPLDPDSVRSRIDHPLIDADGHLVEFLPEVRDHLREIAGDSLLGAFDAILGVWQTTRQLPPDAKRNAGLFRMTWWGFPAENTLDRASAMLPRLLHARLDEIGLDFAVLFPTFGLGALSVPEPELRGAVTRAYNRYYAEATRGLGDRLCAAALIPMHTPEEALAELDHCVGELGFRAVVMAGHVRRPLPGAGQPVPPGATWLDTFGVDSAHDYDPVWRRCVELGVAPAFHSAGMGWGSRASLSSYVFNHLGNFAAAGEATARSLLLGGVTRRFPRLRMAFLEGGVGWAANLLCDLIGHWRKRGARHIHHYDPARIDRAAIRALFDRWGGPRTQAHLADPTELESALGILSDAGSGTPGDPGEGGIDEFAACDIRSVEDFRARFVEPFYFGCEADDPLNKLAFDPRANPLSARLRAVFSSDIGHWDVPDMRGVVGEAWEGVESGGLSPEEFRAFTFGHAVSLWAGANPRFFEGTRVADAARAELERIAAPAA